MITLDPGERGLLLTRRHPLPALGGATLQLLITLVVALAIAYFTEEPLLSLPVVLLGALLFGIYWLSWRRDMVFVTDRRLVHRWGIIMRQSSETAVDRIGDVRISQGPLGRAFDYGDLEIVAGSDLGVDRLRAIARPEAISSALRHARES